ncbi:hypothetical protein MKJ01_14155 [Chryseobacterium sp. SSA4.19]|uniref:hypothetical protein n=1 Tax=Chryseobacterium sp. SSA4.19 TaxID=2919915 RepID=UPI001F4D8B1E|nr:hypothetical protein [Chryseobacterium sp. SSA4.19]MCJ8154909.1 hypothetical protein [Chryseobacterium sp. SSA4.19]
MKNLFYSALFLFSTLAYGQITFENGYFIDLNGEKKNVLIKNYEWKNSPSSLEYKVDETSVPLQLKISDLNEFSVGNQKYIAKNVMIDRSSSKIEYLSTSKDFTSNEERLLLKLIVEGDISLYSYSDGSVTRFFYKKSDDNEIKPLRYKEYLVNNTQIKKNEEYKKQLNQIFINNKNISETDIDGLSYNENQLKKVFKIYNNINDPEKTNRNGKGNNFNIYLKPGIGFSNYKILPPSDNLSIGVRKEDKIIFRAAVELEYVLPFNKGKWAIFLEPAFLSAKFAVTDYNRRNFEVNYSSLQIPLGVKYNMFINQRSKVYVAGLLQYNMMLGKHTFSSDNRSYTGDDRVYPSFAAGYNYDKFGIEIKWGVIPLFSSSYYGQYHNFGMDGINLSVSYKLF